MRKPPIICLIFVLIAVAAIYVTITFQSKHKTGAAKGVATVSAVKLTMTTFQPQIEAVGNFTANQGVTLKAEASGRITKINFVSGQMVKKGDVLVEFNNLKEKGALAYAKAQHTLSAMTFKRNNNLKNTGAVSQEALDEAKASLDSNQGNIEMAEGDYNLTIIKAPFDGRLGLKNISIGDYLDSGDDLVTLQNLNPVFLDFPVAQKYLPQIHNGEKVVVEANTLPGSTVSGAVKGYETVIDTQTGMLMVRASVPNKEQTILPGAYAEVTLYAGEKQSVLTVPQTSIIYDATGNYVYLVKDSRVVKQIVELGQQVDQSIEITKGLSVGDQVVSAGTNKLHDGSKVTIAPDDNTQDAA
jgi:membrane fusion protein (multidrug efflux system)